MTDQQTELVDFDVIPLGARFIYPDYPDWVWIKLEGYKGHEGLAAAYNKDLFQAGVEWSGQSVCSVKKSPYQKLMVMLREIDREPINSTCSP